MAENTTGFRKIKPDDRAALAESFSKVTFPASRTDVLTHCGNDELEWSGNDPIMLVDAVREIHQEQFSSADELIDALLSSIRLAFGDRTESEAALLQ